MDFSKYPCGVPVHVNNAEKINDIMTNSWIIQKELSLSNACSVVNAVLYRCLKAIGVDVNQVYGVLLVDEHSKTPHVWLDIEGHVVDNTFVTNFPDHLLKTTKDKCTYKATSVKDEEDLYLGDHVTHSIGMVDHVIKQFEWGLLNGDKYLAFFKNKFQLSQYFKRMTDFMLIKYKVNVEQVSETVVTNCWGCDRSDLSLKVCGDCKIAKYCNKECQRKNRKIHKLVCLKLT